MWAAINKEGHFSHVSRCTVECLMAIEGLKEIRRRKKNCLQAAPMPAIVRWIWWILTSRSMNPMNSGSRTLPIFLPPMAWVYVAFVVAAFAREIVGWQITNHIKGCVGQGCP